MRDARIQSPKINTFLKEPFLKHILCLGLYRSCLSNQLAFQQVLTVKQGHVLSMHAAEPAGFIDCKGANGRYMQDQLADKEQLDAFFKTKVIKE